MSILQISFSSAMVFGEDSAKEQVLLPPANSVTDTGIVMLISSNAEINFFTQPYSEKGPAVGETCPDTFTWLPTDTSRSVLPRASFWHVKVRDNSSSPTVYACIGNTVVALGRVDFGAKQQLPNVSSQGAEDFESSEPGDP